MRLHPSSLGALARSEIQEIIRDAELAALDCAMADGAAVNPHPGGRAQVLWEATFLLLWSDFTDDLGGTMLAVRRQQRGQASQAGH